ncbi:16S rRNA (guanine(527)-N(7))-methyltransferase RsmG [Oculatella sp. LEGE 06141]|uniref:16S rRNA (guanine(527)-N(7))-methyltransferase RsmG n=1 Tax=Oculatella sp. LEGE 06141 TaxID=1828648 RepID=UPI00187EB720|nr:16S rRNA (guanine(527)-N(7))-methyltransferase RsmG [Oculatella sp. LEGE 06141]MBE9178372.1 16S rRNA (guanine(527)-N(7))-methyltransferase RsmG [Oculatella sp. LEGE 06141]
MMNPNTPTLSELASLWQETLNWQPTPAQQTQFQHLYELILEGNRQLNLTRITEPEEFWEKHLWDSLRGVAPLFVNQDEPSQDEPSQDEPSQNAEPPLETTASPFKVIDIGTGAGFPGVPIAIARPDWTLTLLDSTRKKIAFLDSLLLALALQNAHTLVGRAEQVGRIPRHREQYDLALIRAVGSAAVCAEYALPLLKIGGLAVLYRGQWTEAEAEPFAAAVEQLGGAIATIDPFTTPTTQGIRHCLQLRKVAPTSPRFPRSGGSVQQPLV